MPILRFMKEDDNSFEALYPNYDGIDTYTMSEIEEYITLTNAQRNKFKQLKEGKVDFISLRLDKTEGANLIQRRRLDKKPSSIKKQCDK